MADRFPALSFGKVTKYPVARVLSFKTEFARFNDDSTQRWSNRVRLERFTLALTHLSLDDLNTFLAFVDLEHGARATNWELLFDGILYPHCGFASDPQVYEENDLPELYSVQVQVQQIVRPDRPVTAAWAEDPVRFEVVGHGYPDTPLTYVPPQVRLIGGTGDWSGVNGIWDVARVDDDTFTVPSLDASAAGAYVSGLSARLIWYPKGPDIPEGTPGPFPGWRSRFQRPYGVTAAYRTMLTDQPDSGMRYTTALRTSPRPYCDPQHTALYSWQLTYNLPPEELALLEWHFFNAGGRYRAFDFQDPQGNAHAPCGYGMDDLEIRYEEPGRSSARVTVVEL